MVIPFSVGDVAAEFRWNNVTGKAQLQLGKEIVELQSPLKLSTHFQLKRSKSWTTEAQGHEITIVKQRPRFLAGFRKNQYTVSVDGAVVAKTSGR